MVSKKHDIGALRRAEGDANRERIREFFKAHVGASNREAALVLGLNEAVIGRHVKVLRAEWSAKRRKSGRT